MVNRPVGATVVAVALAGAAAALLLAAPGPRAVPSHDDAISILAASGSLDDWQAATAEPVTVMSAEQWRSFSRVEGFPDVTDIAAGMGRWDLHPPLYPLLLGVWGSLFGTSLAGSLALNAVLLGLTGAVVFVIVRDLGFDAARGWAAGLLAAVGPAALATGLEIRAYALAGLLSAVVILAAAVAGPLGRRRGAVLLLGATALMLTHYSGIWLLLGVALARMYLAAPRTLGTWVRTVAPLAAAPLAAAALFPFVFDQMARQAGQQRTPVGDVDLVTRGTDVVIAMASFLVLGRPAVVLGAAALVVVACVVVLVVRGGTSAMPRLDEESTTSPSHVVRGVGLIAVVTLSGLCGAFLLGLTPNFSMASKYLAFAAPAVAVAIGAGLPRTRPAVVGTALVGLAVAASWSALIRILPTVAVDPGRYDVVLVDSDSRGVVPRVAWHLPADTLVVVGDQSGLVDHLGRGRDEVGCHLYVSSLRHGGTEAGRDEILAALPSGPEPLPDQFAAIGPAWQAGCS